MADVKYYINSNNGDYIEYGEAIVFVFDGGHRIITDAEFKAMKGFLPIKKKKMDILRGRGHLLYMPQGSKDKWGKYKPTLKGGVKDVAAKTETKESVFLDTIQGMSRKADFNEYPSRNFWFKKEEYMFEVNPRSNQVWCSPNVWNIFETRFDMTHHEIQEFLSIMLEKRFGFGKVDKINKATEDMVAIYEIHFKDVQFTF